jgi:hypothetical protein
MSLEEGLQPKKDIIREGEEALIRKEIRVNTPNEQIKNFLLNTNFDPWIREHENFIKELANDPYNVYISLRNRLKLGGQTVSFPELRGVVGYLIKNLFQNETIYAYYNLDVEKQTQLKLLTHKLIAIMTRSKYYFPYANTLYAIEGLLSLLDIYYRATNSGTSEEAPEFYHNFRYRSYLDYLILDASPENVTIPTFVNTGSTFFIKIRCVPITILGITDKPTLADQYINSPIDFWAHDIQHARRQIQETEAYYDRFVKHSKYYSQRSPFDIITKDEFYKYMADFTKFFVLPLLKVTKGEDPTVVAYKKIIKLLIFEVVHEKAWPITKLALCRCTPLLYDIFPIENLAVINDEIDTNDQQFNDPTTLSNLRGKLRHGFYDLVEDPNPNVLPVEYRTSKKFAEAAKILLTLLNCGYNPKLDLLVKLTKDTTNAGEFSQVSPIELPDDPLDFVDYTEAEKEELNKSDIFSSDKIKSTNDNLEMPQIPEDLNAFIIQSLTPVAGGSKNKSNKKMSKSNKKMSNKSNKKLSNKSNKKMSKKLKTRRR